MNSIQVTFKNRQRGWNQYNFLLKIGKIDFYKT